MTLLDQLKQWRGRRTPEQPDDDAVNEQFSLCFGNPAGVAVLDYLMLNYLCVTVESGFDGPAAMKLAEINGQRIMMNDILHRIEKGAQARLPKQADETQGDFDARR